MTMSVPSQSTNSEGIPELHKGSCLCKAVTYGLHGAPLIRNACHCANCKKQTGTAFFSTAVYAREHLKLLSGESSIKTYEDQATGSGSSLLRQFCKECGSTLFAINTKSQNYIAVCAGTMDDLKGFRPDQEFFAKDRLTWVTGVDGARSYDTMSPDL